MGAGVANILGGGIVGEVMKGLDGLFTSDKERLEAEARLTEILQRPNLAQIDVNKTEAAHASVFVAGWRPAIGWVCATALGWNFIGHDLALWGVALAGKTVAVPAPVAMGQLFELVLAMLGLGAFRTVEKVKGKA